MEWTWCRAQVVAVAREGQMLATPTKQEEEEEEEGGEEEEAWQRQTHRLRDL